MPQGEPDELYMLRDDFNAEGIRALKRFGLAYDILIFERHLPQTIEFVDRHPSQVFVLDRIAKPQIKDGLIEPWNTGIRKLAKRGCRRAIGMRERLPAFLPSTTTLLWEMEVCKACDPKPPVIDLTPRDAAPSGVTSRP